MASTYVNDLRLNEMATGDQSGSWGTVTNTNLELIAEAFSYSTEAITTNADAHTTTIADGATDPGRSMFLKYTGTLDSTCTITIGPNTVSKLWFIENATSGSQDIIIKQGSGATVTIASGKTKVIYSDGVGSGAKMVDAFDSLSVGALSTTGDINFGDNDKAIFGAGSDLQIYHNGGDSLIADTGTGDLYIRGSNNIFLQKGDGSETFMATADDGAVTLYHNNATKLATTATGIQVTGNIANASGDLTIDAASYLMLDADGGNIVLQDNADTFGRFVSTNDDFIIQSDSTDKDIIFKGNDGGSTITALTLDMSASGDAIFNSDVVMGSTGKLRSNGDDDSYLQFNQANVLRAVIGDSTRMIISTGETVFNEDSGDFDFRVESNGQSSMLFVDGGNDRVGVGTSSPSTDFEVRKGVTSAIRVSGGSNTNYKTEIGYDNSTGPYIKAGSSGIQSLQFYVDNTSLALTLASNDVATFTSDVNATNFNSTSDATLKTNVETLTGSLDAVKSLRGVSFDWLENGGSEIGVIAQEVEDVLPDVVNTNEDGIKSVKYGNIVAVLIEAMKEQQAQIDELKTQINS